MTFALAARDGRVALRLHARARGRSARAPAGPLALRWRRRERPADARGRRAARRIATRASGSLQLHLHFAERASSAAAIVDAPASHVRVVVVRHRRRGVRSATSRGAWRSRRLPRAARRLAATDPGFANADVARREVHRRSLGRRFAGDVSHSGAACARHVGDACSCSTRGREQATLVASIADAVASVEPRGRHRRGRMHRDVRRSTRARSTADAIRARHTAAIGRRLASRRRPSAACAPARPHRDGRDRIAAGRTRRELMWRRPTSRSRAASADGPATRQRADRGRSARAAPSGRDAARDAEARRAARTPAASARRTSTPRLLDRLTDDVIRRVERRVRIERERRGL